MKPYLILLLALIFLGLGQLSARAGEFSQGHLFIFYAVLDGCFEDGLKKEQYAHFVYACQTCTPAIHAFEVYRSRPAHFYSLKSGASTFGDGLPADLKKQLYSTKPEERQEAINALMRGWVSRRMSTVRLSEAERSELQEVLALMGKKGLSLLDELKSSDPAAFKVSVFANVGKCAVCTGACGWKLKPEAGK